MLNNKNNLQLSAQDIELIEAALHTQQKILFVQSEAGGTGARQRLTDLQQLMQRIGRARHDDGKSPSPSWAQSAFNYLMCPNHCRASN